MFVAFLFLFQNNQYFKGDEGEQRFGFAFMGTLLLSVALNLSTFSVPKHRGSMEPLFLGFIALQV